MTGADEEFDTTMANLEQSLADIGYPNTEMKEVTLPQNPDSESTDSQSLRKVIVANTVAGPEFAVVAEEGASYFQVQASYQLWDDFAEALSSDKVSELLTDELRNGVPDGHPAQASVPPKLLQDPDKREPILAAFEYLDNLDQDLETELIFRLTEIFARAEVKHVIDSTAPDGGVTGFTVFYKIFPYESDFGLRTLNEVVEQVRMATHHGSLFLRHTFNIGVDISKNTAGDPASPSVPDATTPPDELTDDLPR
jgi:hypothetical protein